MLTYKFELGDFNQQRRTAQWSHDDGDDATGRRGSLA